MGDRRGDHAGVLFPHGPSGRLARAASIHRAGVEFDRRRSAHPLGDHRTMKKIGFIAMSGIRAQNQELLQMGLTLPGFVERSKVIASLPSLSLLTLAGLTPKKFAVEYREIADLKLAGPLPEDFDLVAITSLSA